MASPKAQWQMAAHHRKSQVESASTIVTMAYDPIGPRNSKDQRLNDPVHTGCHLRGFGQSLPTPMTNINWHSPSATDSKPSHSAPSAIKRYTSRIQNFP